MSADNYYIIRKHPDGGFAAVMGFASDDGTPDAERRHQSFNTVEEALIYAGEDGYTEYGISVHPECSPTRAGREGDTQPMPVANDAPSVQDAVIAEIEKRKAVGLERYGTLLQPHNGRDMLRDAFEEALDLTCYLMGALIERES